MGVCELQDGKAAISLAKTKELHVVLSGCPLYTGQSAGLVPGIAAQLVLCSSDPDNWHCFVGMPQHSDRIICASLGAGCVTIVKAITGALQRDSAAQRCADLKEQLSAARQAGTDFNLMASLGQALEAARVEAVVPSLNEEQREFLVLQHATLLQRVEAKCRDLARDAKWTLLAPMAAHLDALRGLDVAALHPWINDPVYVENTVPPPPPTV